MLRRASRSSASTARVQARCFFSATPLLLKKSGKPTETPPAPKQAYLPYDVAPTKAELEAARRKFMRVARTNRVTGKTITYNVTDVPENMYTYGKEGMQIPISIFKDETDPIIAAEHTYPGIYENKILLKHMTTGELMDAFEKNEFDSPLRRGQLMVRVNTASSSMAMRMANMARRMETKWEQDRAGSGSKPAAAKVAAKGGDAKANPDAKAAAAPAKGGAAPAAAGGAKGAPAAAKK